MEVQKHPHHVMHSKKWHEYALEFLMLFLAVFLGFIAENIREGVVEKERATQYLESFYEDLKSDTRHLNYIIQFDNEKVSALNNMTACYDTVSKNWQNTQCLGLLIRYSKTNRAFQITDRTLKQLDNAGGFRLLKQEDADSILSYETDFNSYHDFQATVFQEAQDNVRNTTNMLTSFKAVDTILKTSTLRGSDTTNYPVIDQLLFSNDKVLLNKWFNELSLYQRVTIGQLNLLTRLRNKAAGLLNYFNNKYHFEKDKE